MSATCDLSPGKTSLAVLAIWRFFLNNLFWMSSCFLSSDSWSFLCLMFSSVYDRGDGKEMGVGVSSDVAYCRRIVASLLLGPASHLLPRELQLEPPGRELVVLRLLQLEVLPDGLNVPLPVIDGVLVQLELVVKVGLDLFRLLRLAKRR